MFVNKPLTVIVAGSNDSGEIDILETAGLEVLILPDVIDDKAISHIRRADALILGMKPLTAAVIEAAPTLKVIARHGVGYDNVDVKAATEAGIYVTNTPRSNTQTVAEFTIGLMINVTRRIASSAAYVDSGHWRKPDFWGPELCGRRLGLIGFGNIGKKVAELASAFGMRIFVYDPFFDPAEGERHGVNCQELVNLLADSDIVSLHCALTRDTRFLIGTAEFERMKPGAYLINTARGGLIDENALLTAVESGSLAGAALDALIQEPPDNSALIDHPNILVTPHIAGWGVDAGRNMCIGAAEQVAQVLAGSKPKYAVNEPSKPRNIKTD